MPLSPIGSIRKTMDKMKKSALSLQAIYKLKTEGRRNILLLQCYKLYGFLNILVYFYSIDNST
jgi:hypothetical protein